MNITNKGITDFFDKAPTKKRKVSYQSSNSDLPKKMKEGGSQTNSSSFWDEVFLEDLTSDQADSTVVKFMKRLEAQLRD